MLSITFAAPSLTRSLGLDNAALGLVLSSSLFGMLIGSLAIGPVADIAGRRPLVMTSLALLMAGTLLTAFGQSTAELAAWGFVTGLGIGSMVAVIVPLAAWLLRSHGWPSLSFLGFAIAGVAWPVGGLLLAEKSRLPRRAPPA